MIASRAFGESKSGDTGCGCIITPTKVKALSSRGKEHNLTTLSLITSPNPSECLCPRIGAESYYDTRLVDDHKS